jgi:lipase chaperone LimK
VISLTADDTMLLKDMGMFVEPVEVYDAAGKLLGLFVPANLERGKELQARAAAQVDWAEIERRQQSDETGDPFEAVQERLQLLEAEVQRRRAAGEKELTEEEAVEFMRRLRQQTPASNDSSAARSSTAEKDRCAIP